MSQVTKTQSTIDGKLAPVLPPRHAGGGPRLPIHMQTPKHEYNRERQVRRRAIHRQVDNLAQQRSRSCRRITNPPLPYKRVPVLVRANALLEWHATCPGSVIFPVSSESDSDTEEYPPSSVEDDYRYLSTPPLLERRSHHDE